MRAVCLLACGRIHVRYLFRGCNKLGREQRGRANAGCAAGCAVIWCCATRWRDVLVYDGLGGAAYAASAGHAWARGASTTLASAAKYLRFCVVRPGLYGHWRDDPSKWHLACAYAEDGTAFSRGGPHATGWTTHAWGEETGRDEVYQFGVRIAHDRETFCGVRP